MKIVVTFFTGNKLTMIILLHWT